MARPSTYTKHSMLVSQNKQVRQCTYNVTLRIVFMPIVVVEKQ